MPCYEVNTMSVKIEAADRDLLEKALDRLKLKYQRNNDNFAISTSYGTINISSTKATLDRRDQATLNKIKQAYATEVIEEGARKYNWTLVEEGEYVVLRRYSFGADDNSSTSDFTYG